MANCINCKSKKIMLVVKLEPQPLSGVFLDKKINKQIRYPLNLYRCENCKLVQFKKKAKKIKMFGDTYEYKTSLSDLMINHIYKKVKFFKEKRDYKNKFIMFVYPGNDFLNYRDPKKNYHKFFFVFLFKFKMSF